MADLRFQVDHVSAEHLLALHPKRRRELLGQTLLLQLREPLAQTFSV